MAVDIRLGESIQAAVSANPAGTVFNIKSGIHIGPSAVHIGQSVVPKDDMQFVGEAGAVLDGAGREFAFAGVKGGTGGKRVVLRGLEIRNYRPAAQSAAIRPFGMAYDWIIEDCEIHHNVNWGMQVDSGWQVRRCHIHHNGTLGLGGGGDALIETCAIYGNNTSGADSHWEAGGTKFVYADGLIIRDCDVFENNGPGIWFDGHTFGASISGNRVRDNRGPGIDWEINGPCVIEGNTCLRNGLDPNWADDYDLGGGGVLIIDSAGVVICNNTILDNAGGIGLVDDNRSGRASWPNLENIDIYSNTIGYTQRKTGVAIASGRPPLATSVRFHDNHYQIDPTRVGFRVGSISMAFPAWQSRWAGEALYVEPPEPIKPGVVGNLTPSYRLTWIAPSGPVVSYTVQRKVSDVWGTVLVTTDTFCAVAVRGAYRVRAFNNAGTGLWTRVTV